MNSSLNQASLLVALVLTTRCGNYSCRNSQREFFWVD